MGGCCSSTPSASRANTTTTTNDTTADPRHRHRRRYDVPQSLVRVGSKVLRGGDDHQGEQQLKVTRASTYDHVHKAVTLGLEDNNPKDAIQRKKAGGGRVGLRNLGNTCFLNSSVQCLSNTIPLADYCLGYDYRKEINRGNLLGTQGQLVTAYTELMKRVWLGNDSSLDPSDFYSCLVRFAPQFGGGDQHDSQEVLTFLLDGIHEDLNRVKQRPYLQDKDCDGSNDEGDAVLAWQNYLLRNRSIVVDLFQGQLRNTMTCRNKHKKRPDGTAGCGHCNIKFEPFMYLSLPISNKTSTLEECLDLYCTEEHLVGDNQWYCPSCQTHVDATKKFDLWMLPPILIVHLKRFDCSGNKVETPILYPVQNWDLSRAVQSKSGLYPLFDLYAVSNHVGDLGGGHYTAFVKNRFDEEWYEMNDSASPRKVRAEAEVGSNPSAYCLFYNRVESDKGNDRKRNDPKIMRQSLDRPELWPHMQMTTTDFRNFQRSTFFATTSMPSIAE